MRLDNYANLRLTFTYNTSLDDEVVQFRDITTDRLKTNLYATYRNNRKFL